MAPGNPKRKKILIVEDDTYVHELLSFLFTQQKNYDVLVSDDSFKAFSMLDEQTPDLIFLDFMLPRMDGVEFCRKLRKNEKTKNIPVVMMSASAKLNDVDKKELGVEYSIAKPFNMTEILGIIDKIFKGE